MDIARHLRIPLQGTTKDSESCRYQCLKLMSLSNHAWCAVNATGNFTWCTSTTIFALDFSLIKDFCFPTRYRNHCNNRRTPLQKKVQSESYPL